MRYLYILLLMATFSACSPCMKTEGEIETRELILPPIESFHLKGASTVRFMQGQEQKVTITAPSDAIELLNQNMEGQHWNIAFDPCLRNEDDIIISITVPELNEISLSGSGTVTGDGFFNTTDILLAVSGSGDLSATINAATVTATLSGSGDINLAGSGSTFNAAVDGSGEVDAREFTAKSAVINVDGSGDAAVSVSEELQARVSGSGDVTYYGNPKNVKSDISGSGDITKR